jgi:hypothetical protein
MLKFLLLALLSMAVEANVLDAPLSTPDFQQPPPELNWKKIDTRHFEVIFPQEIEAEAQRVAFVLERAYEFVARSLDAYPHKIPVVLHNQSTISNGFVTLAPRRSEWFVTPAIDPILTNTEWLKTLAIHEFRHVVQFQRARRSFNKIYEMLLGEVGLALGLGLSFPPWFYEGDAVGIETALTQGGRGRLPLFDRDLRTLLLEGERYSYDKAHLGSYENFVPNMYVYGYFYTSYMRNHYGDLFLARLTGQATHQSYNPYTFYNSAERAMQRSFEDFYEGVMQELLTEWRKRFDELKPTPLTVKNLGPRPGWTNYFYPQQTDQGKVLALKQGLSHIRQFVLLNGPEEEVLFYPGILMHEFPYKLRRNKFAFTELELDPRWGLRDFTRLRVYDLDKRDFVLDLRWSKLRLPVISHDGEWLAAVEWNERQEQSIVVLDLNGRLLARRPFAKDQIITSIDWTGPDSLALVVKSFDDLKRIVGLAIDSGEEQELLPKTNTNLGFLTAEEGVVLFESPESGIDNLFVLSEKGARQLTSARFGAYAPHLKNGQLYFNDYTVDGMNVVQKELPWDEEQKSSGSFYPIYEKFAAAEGAESLAQQLASPETYEVQDYSQVGKAINLHSWVILAPPLSNQVTLAGYSRDVLNKFTLGAGATHNLNESTTEGFVTANWQHRYPVFDIRAAYGSRRQFIWRNNEFGYNRWEEGSAELGISVPWNRITGRFNQSFTARAFSKLMLVNNRVGLGQARLNDGAMHSPGAQLMYGILARQARRDILPPLGLMLIGHLEEGRDISGNDQGGGMRMLDARFYLPGVLPHHHFYHQHAYEWKRDDDYQYAGGVRGPRGTEMVFLNELFKYSANYTFPLYNPDWNWGGYVYFRRFIANVFYDEMGGRYRSIHIRRASTGAEFILETNFFRLALPIQWGVRRNIIVAGPEADSLEIFFMTGLGSF